jgi:hypothetical protein
MMKRRLREGVEFFAFLKEREEVRRSMDAKLGGLAPAE